MRFRAPIAWLAFLLCWTWLTPAARAGKYKMQKCHQVVVVLEDPFDHPGEEAGEKVLDIVCDKLEELAPLFGLKLQRKTMLQIFIPIDMKSFFRHTGRSYHTLALYSSARGIITQPGRQLKALRTLGRLERTVTHELVHFLIDRTTGGVFCPMWLNEGLAQWFEGHRPRGQILMTEAGLAALERRWRSPVGSVAQRRQDYLISLELTARVIHQVGQEELLGSLREFRRLREDPLLLEIKGRSLRELLFSAEGVDAAYADAASRIEVERGVEWDEELAEELGAIEEMGGKVYDFDEYRRNTKPGEPDGESGDGVTELPLKEMIKKARKKKQP